MRLYMAWCVGRVLYVALKHTHTTPLHYQGRLHLVARIQVATGNVPHWIIESLKPEITKNYGSSETNARNNSVASKRVWICCCGPILAWGRSATNETHVEVASSDKVFVSLPRMVAERMGQITGQE